MNFGEPDEIQQAPHHERAVQESKKAVAEMKKLFNLGWDFGPALNKAASEFGVDARALYAYAAMAPADLME
jgi:hypothetical protein